MSTAGPSIPTRVVRLRQGLDLRDLLALLDALLPLLAPRRPQRGAPSGRGVFGDTTPAAFVEKVFALADARRRRREEPAFPSRRQIARHFDCSESTISRYVGDHDELDLDQLGRRWATARRGMGAAGVARRDLPLC